MEANDIIGTCKAWETQIVGYEAVEEPEDASTPRYASTWEEPCMNRGDECIAISAFREPPEDQQPQWYKDLKNGKTSTETQAEAKPNPFQGAKLTEGAGLLILGLFFACVAGGIYSLWRQSRAS